MGDTNGSSFDVVFDDRAIWTRSALAARGPEAPRSVGGLEEVKALRFRSESGPVHVRFLQASSIGAQDLLRAGGWAAIEASDVREALQLGLIDDAPLAAALHYLLAFLTAAPDGEMAGPALWTVECDVRITGASVEDLVDEWNDRYGDDDLSRVGEESDTGGEARIGMRIAGAETARSIARVHALIAACAGQFGATIEIIDTTLWQ